jgi:hypothetical protein
MLGNDSALYILFERGVPNRVRCLDGDRRSQKVMEISPYSKAAQLRGDHLQPDVGYNGCILAVERTFENQQES